MNDTPGPSPDPHAGSDDVGSVGDEAAKLFGALSDWAREHGGDLGHGLSDLAGQAAGAVREVEGHVATGATECTYCPLCRTVHAVREAGPEVREHLGAAVASLAQAAAGFLAAASKGAAGEPRPGVERIDLDQDAQWPEDDQ